MGYWVARLAVFCCCIICDFFMRLGPEKYVFLLKRREKSVVLTENGYIIWLFDENNVILRIVWYRCKSGYVLTLNNETLTLIY